MKTRVLSLASLSVLRIQRFHELWVGCRCCSDPALLRVQCRPGICSSKSTPDLGTAICCRHGLKRQKKKVFQRTMVPSPHLAPLCLCLHIYAFSVLCHIALDRRFNITCKNDNKNECIYVTTWNIWEYRKLFRKYRGRDRNMLPSS